MVCVIQRTVFADVNVDGDTVGQCGEKAGERCASLLVFAGIKAGDTEETVERMAEKILKMRIFEDENGKMNLSVKDIGGDILSVSNFTLCASCRRGTRPDFTAAEKPDRAKELYGFFLGALRKDVKVSDGVFGADMNINTVLSGPVTIILDSEKDLASKV